MKLCWGEKKKKKKVVSWVQLCNGGGRMISGLVLTIKSRYPKYEMTQTPIGSGIVWLRLELINVTPY